MTVNLYSYKGKQLLIHMHIYMCTRVYMFKSDSITVKKSFAKCLLDCERVFLPKHSFLQRARACVLCDESYPLTGHSSWAMFRAERSHSSQL